MKIPKTFADLKTFVPVAPTALPGWSCLHCGHTWMGRKAPYQASKAAAARKPKKCPRCDSDNWFRPKKFSFVREGKVIARVTI